MRLATFDRDAPERIGGQQCSHVVAALVEGHWNGASLRMRCEGQRGSKHRMSRRSLHGSTPGMRQLASSVVKTGLACFSRSRSFIFRGASASERSKRISAPM
jgi:hypothetical protein